MIPWWFLAAAVLLAGCAGKPANPTRVYRADDAARSCADIEAESQQILATLGATEAERNRLVNQNLGLYIAGQLLLLPAIAMDVTGSRDVEHRALVARLQRLGDLANERGC